MMSLTQLGNPLSGFASGGVSSLVSSSLVTTKASDAVVIIGGSLSGGVGAAITGGSFYQGALMGLISGGLNHLAHEIASDYAVDKELREIGIEDPSSKAPENESSINKVMKTKNYDKVVVDENNNIIHGEYSELSGEVSIYKTAFKSWRLLASTIGHELIHAYHYINNNFMYKFLGDNFHITTSKIYSEYLAHTWENSYSGLGTMSNYYLAKDGVSSMEAKYKLSEYKY